MEKQKLSMLHVTIVALLILLSIVLAGCSGKADGNDSVNDKQENQVDVLEYEVTVVDEYASECDVGRFYPAGETVTVKLPALTEHYYTLYVNGEEQQMDRDLSDMVYTYFTFIMPDCDVTITIEDHWVDIPDASEQ